MPVPEFISYNNNKVSFQPSDIPVNYQIAELEKYVPAAYRSGSIVNFGITKLQAFEGRLFLVRKGEKKPAESAVLEIKTNGKSVVAVIGKRGEFVSKT